MKKKDKYTWLLNKAKEIIVKMFAFFIFVFFYIVFFCYFFLLAKNICILLGIRENEETFISFFENNKIKTFFLMQLFFYLFSLLFNFLTYKINKKKTFFKIISFFIFSLLSLLIFNINLEIAKSQKIIKNKIIILFLSFLISDFILDININLLEKINSLKEKII